MNERQRVGRALLLSAAVASAGACVADQGSAPEAARDAVEGGRAVAALRSGASVEADEHEYFSTVRIASSDSVTLAALGDLWVNCWSDDDAVYTVSGDGTGFNGVVGELVASRIDGRPDDANDPLRGTSLAVGASIAQHWNAGYTMKPTGMLCVDGDLYLAVQDLRALAFDEAPAATIVRSSDKGRTWTWDKREPMFSDFIFTTIMFADFGRDSEHAPDDYAYAYGLDDNWSSAYAARPPQTKLYLARVPKTKIQDRTAWEFFSGYGAEGMPTWTPDIARRQPVLEDTSRRYEDPLDRDLDPQAMTAMSQGDVIYNAALQRYIFATWTMYTYELYEAPQPWGPWTHFYTHDFGVFPWTEQAAGGYGTTIPTKFISADGRSMWMHSNVWQAGVIHYQYSLRKLELTQYQPSEPDNDPGPESLATQARGAVPLVRVARSGQPELMYDGTTANQSEESWNGERKREDYWGFTWPRVQRINTLRYTTGRRDDRGGWFEELSVQVRKGKAWVAATGLNVTPEYSHDASVLGNKTFTLRFDESVTDGVRIYGVPGGSDAFTNIAELSVHDE